MRRIRHWLTRKSVAGGSQVSVTVPATPQETIRINEGGVVTHGNPEPSPDRSSSFSSSRDVRIFWLVDDALKGQEDVVMALHGQDAQYTLDAMQQQYLDEGLYTRFPGPDPQNVKHRIRRLLLRLVLRCDQVPSQVQLLNVTRRDREPVVSGGFADIYRGEYKGIPVALKRLRTFRAEGAARQSYKKNLLRESMIWKSLSHDHVLPFLGVADEVFPDSLCIVTPWMDQGDVRQAIDYMRTSGNTSLEDLFIAVHTWMKQTVSGLVYLHSEGVTHGDLRGSNILIDTAGKAMIGDLVLSVFTEGHSGNYASFRGGVVRWLAPELIDPDAFGLDSTRPTPPADIYAFACLCIELYTSQSPWGGVSESAVLVRVISGRRPPQPLFHGASEMSDMLFNLIQLCWQQQPSSRPDAQEVLHTLSNITSGLRLSGPAQISNKLNMLPEKSADSGPATPDHQDEYTQFGPLNIDIATHNINITSLHNFTSASDDRIVTLLAIALQTSQDVMQHIEGQDIQYVLDAIQQILDDSSYSMFSKSRPGEIKQRLCRLLLRTALKTNKFPTQLLLPDLKSPVAGLRAIGGGSYGDLYLCPYQRGQVVVKKLRNIKSTPELDRAIYRESLMWRSLSHEHVLPFLGISNSVFESSLCMVMQWAAHGDVRKVIDGWPKIEVPSLQDLFVRVNSWIDQISSGLAYLHAEDIVHGDLRGPNVLIDTDYKVRLADFGLAVFASGESKNYASTRSGAIQWLAPELLSPERFGVNPTSTRPTFAADIYSFACVCIELFTSNSPFPQLGHRHQEYQLMSRVVGGDRPPCPTFHGQGKMSEELYSLLCRCWNERVSERPTAAQLVQILAKIPRQPLFDPKVV